MVDETVLRCVVLRLQRTEQRLLGTKNLDSTCWVLRQAEQAAGVADEPRADEVTDERGQVGRDRVHAVAQVLRKLGAVGGDGDDLVAQGKDVRHVGFGNVGTHRDDGGRLQGRLQVLGEDGGEVAGGSICPEA